MSIFTLAIGMQAILIALLAVIFEQSKESFFDTIKFFNDRSKKKEIKS